MTGVLTILDDYQSVALESADWIALEGRYALETVTEHLEGDELVARLADSEIVVAMRERTRFDAALLERLPRLRLLVTTGLRNASIDLEAARRQGVIVSGTRGPERDVAELTMAMLLALARNLVAEDRALHADGWQHTIGVSLAGKTLGLVGLGRQGALVAELAQAFQMRVIAWSPHLTPERAAEHGVTAVGKSVLFESSDFVSIHLALSDSTIGIVGADELAAMRETAYLINTSRGPIVDAEALLMALMVDTIQGAALDVYDVEPLPVADPLRQLDNVLLLPHIGYVTREAYATFYSDAVADVVAFCAGSPIREL